MAAGGEVWRGDETLRSAWARRGHQQIVIISGRNARRVVHGALTVATVEFVSLVRERSRQDDCPAFLDALGEVRPDAPPKRVQAMADSRRSSSPFCPSMRPS